MNKKILVPLAVLGLLILAGLGLKFKSYNANIGAYSDQDSSVTVDIAQGSSSSQIADLLVQQQLIKSASDFNLYLRLNGKNGSLKAGTYELSPSMKVEEIVDVLVAGKVATNTITIIPGSTVATIKKVFLDKGFSEKEVEDAFSNIKPLDYIDGVNASELEGYIYPDTYTIGKSSTVEDYLVLALREFNQKITPELRQGFEQQGLSVNGATILASIVQLESPDADIQKDIAQVFLRRLDEGISLGADPTFRYGARLLGLPETPDVESPYNTRIYTGLTPTPISNFNISALEAVASPSDTNYLYFVAGDDGTTYFTNTLAEHEAATRQYCVELCRL